MNRNSILVALYEALGPDRERARAEEVERRIANPPNHDKPAYAGGSAEELCIRFIGCLQTQSVSVLEAREAADIPAAVASHLASCGAAPEIRTGSAPLFANLPWSEAGLNCVTGAATAGDSSSLSHALAGVAETGTLVLVSGPDNPASLAFLPDTHVIAVRRDRIVGCYEDAFALVRSTLGARRMPRSLNFISGASRTGDIGGRIVMGAHGPRRLAVVIFGNGLA